MQVDQSDQFRLLAEENRINIRLIPPVRGLIFDRTGRVIAGNEQNYRVVIVREDAGDAERVLHRLALLIDLSEEDIARVLRDTHAPPPLRAGHGGRAAVLGGGRQGRRQRPCPARHHARVGLSRALSAGARLCPCRGLCRPGERARSGGAGGPEPVLQIPGFQIGKIGVERHLEEACAEAAGSRRIEVNAVGRVMRELDRRKARPGATCS
jgi:penicillin-binding protein 2